MAKLRKVLSDIYRNKKLALAKGSIVESLQSRLVMGDTFHTVKTHEGMVLENVRDADLGGVGQELAYLQSRLDVIESKLVQMFP
jgi:hypothetical protein